MQKQDPQPNLKQQKARIIEKSSTFSINRVKEVFSTRKKTGEAVSKKKKSVSKKDR